MSVFHEQVLVTTAVVVFEGNAVNKRIAISWRVNRVVNRKQKRICCIGSILCCRGRDVGSATDANAALGSKAAEEC